MTMTKSYLKNRRNGNDKSTNKKYSENKCTDRCGP